MDTVTGVVVVSALAVGVAVREMTWRRAMAATRRRLAETESEARQGEKLAAVGQLVSGLAQELKSPLQGLIGSTELMLASAGEADPDNSRELRQIVDEASRAAGIVRNLLALTETSALVRRWQDLNEIVARAVDARQSELAAAGIRSQLVRTDRLPLVYVDGRQLEKVVTTLLRPGELGEPGCVSSVTVTTCQGQSPEDPLAVNIDVDEEGALADSDDQATWSSGLAACQQVLDAHGGSVTLERRSVGVRIRLELPIAVGTWEPERQSPLREAERRSTAAESGSVETRS
jgi:K+-sensing histidine kinase KdpD